MPKDREEVMFQETSEYRARLDAAKTKQVPVGGAPMPAMPRFDQPPPDRGRGVQQPVDPKAVLTTKEMEELKAKGQFIPGVGAAYKVNQPAARPQKDPAQPEGEYQNPPRPEGAGLRPETVEQLEAVVKANAAKGSDQAKKDDEEEAEIKKEIEDIESEFDFDEFGNRVRTLLANKKRREAIEARCEPMKLEDLLLQDEVIQKVPIIPGKYEPVFRSISGGEELFLKRLMGTERGSEQYIVDKFATMTLAASLYAMNGSIYPTHLTSNKEPDEKTFKEKLAGLLKKPIALLADLSVNYTWFDRRVKKLMVIDDIKGF